MGQNSSEVAYGFGQMGSVYTDLDQVIIPPKNHVIVAIQSGITSTLKYLFTIILFFYFF